MRGPFASMMAASSQWLADAEIMPAVDHVAKHSPRLASRRAAMSALAKTRDPRHGPSCAANLPSWWTSRASMERRFRAPDGFDDAIARIDTVCGPTVLTLRWEALQCLARLEDSRSIPALLRLARSSPESRHEALGTLRKVAKQDLGRTSYALGSEGCQQSVLEAWELASSSRPLAGADVERLKSMALALENEAAKSLAGTKEERAVKAWEAWWRGQDGRAPARYQDSAIASIESPPLLSTRVTLCSSGKVTARSRQPGFEDEASAWGSLDDFDSFVKEYPRAAWARERRKSAFASPLGSKMLEWIHKTALPRLREEKAQGRHHGFPEAAEASCRDRSDYIMAAMIEPVAPAVVPFVDQILNAKKAVLDLQDPQSGSRP